MQTSNLAKSSPEGAGSVLMSGEHTPGDGERERERERERAGAGGGGGERLSHARPHTHAFGGLGVQPKP